MKIKSATVGATEYDLEANLVGGIAKAFPWLDQKELKHQLTFTIKVGHATVTVGGEQRTSLSPRLDALVSYKGKPLAVFELKRPGLTLTEDDESQGLSYARLMWPAPPLVVISNGEENRFLDTYTGNPWTPTTPNEQALKTLIANSSLIAQENLKSAVDCLMGSDPQTWVSIVREGSEAVIADLTGDWSQPLPFVEGFNLPRRATRMIENRLADGGRVVLLYGSPLAGKSNVLLEFTKRAAEKADYAVLYVDASRGLDLHQSVADLLGARFGWPVTPQEARHWLRTLSQAGGPALVLAVDGLSGDSNALKDLETLSSKAFGPGLRLVVAMDDTVLKRLKGVGRAPPSPLVARGKGVYVGLLDDEELEAANEALKEVRLQLPRRRNSPATSARPGCCGRPAPKSPCRRATKTRISSASYRRSWGWT